MFNQRNSIYGFLLLCGFLFGSPFSSIAADTHYVSMPGGYGTNDTAGGYTNWAGAATQIQWAVDAAVDNDTVLVTNGTYNLTNQIFVTNAIILQSVNGRDFTFISGKYTTFRCMLLSNNSVVVSGFTISNGYASGGGVYILGGTLRSCHVCKNYGSSGGGVYATYAGSSLSTRNVFDCIINSNGGQYAGGFWLQGSTASNCVVSYNTASQEGYPGGVLLSTAAKLYDSEISYNSGRGVGGVRAGATIYLSGCKIFGNRGTNTGGLLLTYILGEPKNCLIYNNHAISNAGGLSIDSSGSTVYKATIHNFTVVSNSTDSLTNAGGIHCTGTNELNLYNSIAYFNTSGGTLSNVCNDSNTNLVVSNCCFGMTNGALSPSTNIRNVIYTDPLLINLSAGNCRLSSRSPCINAGVNESWMTNGVDLDGIRRIIYGIVDMGAYERVNEGMIFKAW